jgi:hypothetical protein
VRVAIRIAPYEDERERRKFARDSREVIDVVGVWSLKAVLRPSVHAAEDRDLVGLEVAALADFHLASKDLAMARIDAPLERTRRAAKRRDVFRLACHNTEGCSNSPSANRCPASNHVL